MTFPIARPRAPHPSLMSAQKHTPPVYRDPPPAYPGRADKARQRPTPKVRADTSYHADDRPARADVRRGRLNSDTDPASPLNLSCPTDAAIAARPIQALATFPHANRHRLAPGSLNAAGGARRAPRAVSLQPTHDALADAQRLTGLTLPLKASVRALPRAGREPLADIARAGGRGADARRPAAGLPGFASTSKHRGHVVGPVIGPVMGRAIFAAEGGHLTPVTEPGDGVECPPHRSHPPLVGVGHCVI
ncbi:hypothetical protein PSP31121_05087 [Pandoraea sputorum]|uniref:Uncharacterized protein n=1 Tax=Pandoraea sputorum TaxID=93222 RepID=A0A5E5BIJ9_9BURK|nr:hypothetical protein PSP31121_05087 [Pandoraea sputorum]